LCAPHLEVGGWGNSGRMVRVAGLTVLVAERKGTWLALAATVPFSHASCGYVGKSDGWTDLSGNFQMDWEFDRAADGNIALTGELGLTRSREFTFGLPGRNHFRNHLRRFRVWAPEVREFHTPRDDHRTDRTLLRFGCHPYGRDLLRQKRHRHFWVAIPLPDLSRCRPNAGIREAIAPMALATFGIAADTLACFDLGSGRPFKC
jgi:hypothetical protein